jgi:HEAT repeat protein
VASSKTRSVFEAPTTSTERARLLRTRRWRLADAPAVAAALSDRSVEVRYEAAEALGRVLWRRRRAPHALLRAAADRNSLVRTCVAEALGYIGDKAAAAALTRLLRDEHPVVRSYSACSLAIVSGREAHPALKRALARERSTRARVGHYEGLIRIGQRVFVTPLIDMLGSRRRHVRHATANALAGVPLSADDRTRAIRALEQALKEEPTVAARSTMEAALRDLRRRRTR